MCPSDKKNVKVFSEMVNNMRSLAEMESSEKVTTTASCLSILASNPNITIKTGYGNTKRFGHCVVDTCHRYKSSVVTYGVTCPIHFN